MRKHKQLTTRITALAAFLFVACSSGGGGRPIYVPTGDMAIDNTGTPDMSMKQQLPDFSMNDVPPDLSMVQQPPDMTAVKYMYGCNGLIGCANNCAGNAACNKTCQMNASPASLKLFNNIINCLFVQACRSTNGGVCDSTAMGYVAMNCDTCLMQAQMQGGACYTPLQDCINDKP